MPDNLWYSYVPSDSGAVSAARTIARGLTPPPPPIRPGVSVDLILVRSGVSVLFLRLQ